jgi:acetylornithine deacetylase/succinyl-diaminopimelate desuccinylase-like protein
MMQIALREAWGKDPLLHRIGGAIPVVGELQEQLGIDSVLTGFSLPDDNIHGPDERVHLPTLKRGIEALIRYFFLIARSR